jgi:MFS family permease
MTSKVVSAYSLAYACGLLFSGRIADVYGRKLCFLTGMAIFVIFNVISGVMRVGLPSPKSIGYPCTCTDVQTYIPLCVLRALSGLGMALAGPSGFGIVGAYVTHEPVRTVVFAAFGLGGPIGAATGTLLGGAVAAINA